MLIKPALIFTLATLVSNAWSSPLEKREVATILITPPKDTRIVPYLDQEHAFLDGKSAPFTVTVPEKYGMFTSLNFYWDIFEAGSGFQKQYYHLWCALLVDSDFTGTTEIDIFNNEDDSPTHVKVVDPNTVKEGWIKIGCHPEEDGCRVSDEGICKAIPHWSLQDVL